MNFKLDELIGHLTKKKTRKKKRDNDKADARKESAIVINRVPAPMGSTIEEVLGLPTIELEEDNMIRGVEAASSTLIEIEVMETALVVAPLILPTIMEEVLVAKLSMLARSMEPTIIEVTEEEGPIMACLPVIEAMVVALSVFIEFLIGKAAGETTSEAIGKVASKMIVDMYEVPRTPAITSPEVGCLMRIFPVVIVGSNSHLCGSLPHAS